MVNFCQREGGKHNKKLQYLYEIWPLNRTKSMWGSSKQQGKTYLKISAEGQIFSVDLVEVSGCCGTGAVCMCVCLGGRMKSRWLKREEWRKGGWLYRWEWGKTVREGRAHSQCLMLIWWVCLSQICESARFANGNLSSLWVCTPPATPWTDFTDHPPPPEGFRTDRPAVVATASL